MEQQVTMAEQQDDHSKNSHATDLSMQLPLASDEELLFDDVPKVGMTFMSETEAYDFYNYYGRRVGFSIRKSHTERRRDGSLQSKDFVCSKAGLRVTHSRHVTKKPRAFERTNCMARVRFSINRNGVWRLRTVELKHNHDLATPEKVHMLRSQRSLLTGVGHFMEKMSKAGIKPSEINNFFEELIDGVEKVGSLRLGTRSSLNCQRKRFLHAKDAQALLEFLKNKQTEDPAFFYAVQVDELGQVANFFWADGQAIIDYSYFGDVVSLVSTVHSNSFEMPFALLFGINHHKQPVVFGVAVLLDDTSESFEWLFQTFLTAMSGKHPTTIFTDQSVALSKAVGTMLPSTRHRLSLWHICQNAASNLAHVVSKYPKFLHDFKNCVYEGRSILHFEQCWTHMVQSYGLEGNSWMQNLYAFREKWADIYHLDSFCADMETFERSESVNNDLKKFFHKQLSLSEFVEEYHKYIGFIRKRELCEDYKSRQSKPTICVPSMPMLKTAADSYTRRIYSDFEEQFKKQLTSSCTLISQDGAVLTFRVVPMDYDNEGIVGFNSIDSTVSCSCRMFECTGILCVHALRVFIHCNNFTLPPRYILKRWTKYAKDSSSRYANLDHCDKDSLVLHRRRVCRKALETAIKCSVSREALEHLDKGIEKLASETELLLHGAFNEQEVCPNSMLKSCSSDATVQHSFEPCQDKRSGKLKRTREVI